MSNHASLPLLTYCCHKVAIQPPSLIARVDSRRTCSTNAASYFELCCNLQRSISWRLADQRHHTSGNACDSPSGCIRPVCYTARAVRPVKVFDIKPVPRGTRTFNEPKQADGSVCSQNGLWLWREDTPTGLHHCDQMVSSKDVTATYKVYAPWTILAQDRIDGVTYCVANQPFIVQHPKNTIIVDADPNKPTITTEVWTRIIVRSPSCHRACRRLTSMTSADP